jgi:hypothetical protein
VLTSNKKSVISKYYFFSSLDSLQSWSWICFNKRRNITIAKKGFLSFHWKKVTKHATEAAETKCSRRVWGFRDEETETKYPCEACKKVIHRWYWELFQFEKNKFLSVIETPWKSRSSISSRDSHEISIGWTQQHARCWLCLEEIERLYICMSNSRHPNLRSLG